MRREYGERGRLGTRYKREKKRDLFTHAARSRVRNSKFETRNSAKNGQDGGINLPLQAASGGEVEGAGGQDQDEALGLLGVRLEGQKQTGMEQALDGLGAEQTLEGLGPVGSFWKGREGVPDEQSVAVAAVLEGSWENRRMKIEKRPRKAHGQRSTDRGYRNYARILG